MSKNKKKDNIENEKNYSDKKHEKSTKKKKFFYLLFLLIMFAIAVYFYINMTEPSKIVKKYFQLLNEKRYEEMYDLVSTSYSKDDFVNRIKNIYEGINATNISVSITANSINEFSKNEANLTNNESSKIMSKELKSKGSYTLQNVEINKNLSVSKEADLDNDYYKKESNIYNDNYQNESNIYNDNYQNEFNIDSIHKSSNITKVSFTNSMNTVAGNITFSNNMNVKNENGNYLIEWDSSAIFPELDENEKVKVKTNMYQRGTIYDRNNKIIAKDGEAYSVGIIKNKIDSTTNLNKLSELLNIDKKIINDKINNSPDNNFIELKKFSKENQDLKLELLKIKGVMITDVKSRVYPYKEATSQLTGYVQENEGKDGIEQALNDKLKGEDGKEIYIEKNENKVKSIAEKKVKNGEDIKLTIDADEQTKIYDLFKDDKGAFIKINYNTGEILALVSTPSYNANDFSIGLSNEKWEELKNNENKILFNRCLSTYVPGSTIKPIIGAIGLDTNTFTASEDFGKSNLKWQKDSSWGDFYITTLEKYNETSNLQNALVYSDNIYFAKAALKIGKENLKLWFDKLGFNEEIEFIEKIPNSTYGKLDSEKTTANTCYGQGELMVNPIFMASLYSSFANNGTMCKPYLMYEEKEENKTKIFKQNIISEKTANEIKGDLLEVVKRGTAKECYIEGKNLYGKTGTAEIKASQNDNNGTENGWFDVFDDDGNLYISVCEDVKKKNGSHYVVSKMKNILN